MGDYNDYKLPDPCLRLDFGSGEYNSIELGEGTGYIKLSYIKHLTEYIHCLEEIIDGRADDDDSAFKYKMDCLICNLSNGMISKSWVDNSVIESVITEEFEKAFDEEREQERNDHETLKLYAGKVRDLLIKAYDLADYVWGNVPVKYITVEFCDRMNEIYNEMKELGIEVDG